MNLYWVYDLPNWIFGTLTIGAFVAFAMVGYGISSRLMLRLFGKHPHNDVVSFYLATVGVFYGITLGLIAVGTYETFSDVDKSVSEEAASTAAIYRDVSSYPDPVRQELRSKVESYVHYVIDEEWPMQRQGIVSSAGGAEIDKLQKALDEFNPTNQREAVVHAEALRQFNRLVELRGQRQQSVTSGLPATMYAVIIIGAVLNMMVSWLFVVENRKLHGILNVLMAALLGLLVFLIAAMDNPFRGEFSVGPDAFENVRDHLMVPQRPEPVSSSHSR